jgi:hypothetical protein
MRLLIIFFFFAFFDFKLSILSLRFFKFFQTSHTFRRRWRQCKRVRCRGLGIGVATMERWFSIEAKSFCFSIKEGFSDLRLEERRKKFVGFIFTSSPCAAWLRDIVEAATQVKEDISKSHREGDKVLMVHGGSNKAGRYLEVSFYTEGGRKGVLWILEGRFGRGWRRFAGELRLMLISPNGKSDAEVAESQLVRSLEISPLKLAGVGVHEGCSKACSFVEVLQSKTCLELKDRSRGEMAKGRVVKRPVVVAARFEKAAASVKMTRGSLVQGWVKRLVRSFQIGLGRVWVGLLEGLLNGPKDLFVENRIRAVLGCLTGLKGFGLEYGQAGRNFGLGFRLKPKRRIWAACRCVKSPAPKSSSSKLAAEDHYGAAEAEPPAPTQSVGIGSSPVSSSALPLVASSPEDGVRTGSSSEVQQNPPVCLSEEVAHS